MRASTNIYTYEEAEELAGHGWYNYLVLVTCCLIICACGLDLFGTSVIVAAASCDLNLDFTRIGAVASAPFAGVLFALPWGYYADTRGRKRAALISTIGGFVFALISAFSTHWVFMLILKVIGSCFSQASFSLAMTLLGESTGQKNRNKFLFILNSVNVSAEFFSFGLARLILPLTFKYNVPLLNITFRPWRLYTVLLSLPLAIGTGLLLLVHESPKYLFSRGDCRKTLKVFKKIYKKNGGKLEYPVTSIAWTEGNTKERSFWLDLKEQTLPIFRPPLVWRTLQLYFLMGLCFATNNVFLSWFPILINYFFNSLNTVETSKKSFCYRMFGTKNTTNKSTEFECNEDISPNTLYAGMALNFLYLIIGMLVVQVASRPRLVTIMVLIVSGTSGFLLNVKNPVSNIIFFIMLQSTTMAFGSISSYFVDLYPTTYRALASSLGMMVGRLCALIGICVVGSVISQHCEITFHVWSALVFGGAVISLFLPSDRKAKAETDDNNSM